VDALWDTEVLGVSTGASGVELPEQLFPKPTGHVQLSKYEVANIIKIINITIIT
jgi:hypothetical protein